MNFAKLILVPLAVSTLITVAGSAKAADISCSNMGKLASVVNQIKTQGQPVKIAKLLVADSFADTNQRKQALAIADWVYAEPKPITDATIQRGVMLACMEARHGDKIK
jgi:hypothetical protein